ncbi:hypothetical protein PIB30_107887, partial [Stylosanthes scabra]|nr:hypothetical protein [Stylosanthes scabra]
IEPPATDFYPSWTLIPGTIKSPCTPEMPRKQPSSPPSIPLSVSNKSSPTVQTHEERGRI